MMLNAYIENYEAARNTPEVADIADDSPVSPLWQAGANLLAEIKAEILTVTPDEMSRIRIAAGNNDALAIMQLERLQQADDEATEAIKRDKADIARDIVKYQTPYTFGVEEGRVGE